MPTKIYIIVEHETRIEMAEIVCDYDTQIGVILHELVQALLNRTSARFRDMLIDVYTKIK